MHGTPSTTRRPTVGLPVLLSLLLPILFAAAPAATAAPAPSPMAVQGAGLAGDWLGVLTVGQARLRLALHVEAGEDGLLEATLDSLDQGAAIPVDRVDLAGGSVTLLMTQIGASYDGRMRADGSAITGTWKQADRSFPLTFERTTARTVLERPQEPKPPFPYTAREVAFRNEVAGLQLAGTMIVPAGEGPFPALLFVSGSGPQDRDELVFGHRPFLVIADHLARRGVASLRVDDRGVGRSEGDPMGATVADFATDVAAGIAFLAASPEVDVEAIGILGHSEGGLTGPRVAAANETVAFLVLLAPPGVPLARLVGRQTRDELRRRGVSGALSERALRDQQASLALLQDESLAGEALVEALRSHAGALAEVYSEGERAAMRVQAATPWFRSLVREDPATHLRRVAVPVLALFGERDVQVAPEENASAVRSALAAAGNRDAEIEVLPGLNHLFQHAETGGIEEYGTIEETIAPEVLERIATWIGKRFARH